MSSRIRIAAGAIVYQQHVTYWLDTRSLDGKRRTLATTDRADAINRANEILLAILQKQQPPVFQQQKPISLAALAEEGTIALASERYSAWHKQQNRFSSWHRTAPVIAQFVRWMGPTKPPSAITRRLVLTWRDERAKTCSPSTVNQDVVRIKGWCTWMVMEEILNDNPVKAIRRLKTPTVAKAARSPEEIAALAKAFEGHFLQDFVIVGANVGLRPQETLHLRACDLDENQGLLRVRSWGDWQLKDSEDRALALNRAALDVLVRRKLAVETLGTQALLFPNGDGKPYDYTRFMQVWKKKAPEGIRAYDLRHFMASYAVKAGWSIEKLSKYLGHSSVTTTQRYYADLRALSEVGAPPVLT